jgi:hypothetical protein
MSLSSALQTVLRMPDVGALFYVITQVEYLLLMKGRYVHKITASTFYRVCVSHTPVVSNCRYQVVKAVFSKGGRGTNLDFLQVS